MSNSTMSCARSLQLPLLPELPPPLRGQAFVVVGVAHQGELGQLDLAISPLRDLEPVMDTITEIPTAQLAELNIGPPDPLPAAAMGCCSTTYHHQRSMRLLPVPVMDRDHRCSRWSYTTSVVPLPRDRRTRARSATLRPNSSCTQSESPRTQQLTSKVDAHVQLVERALRPWSASIHYANFDEHSAGGRNRFHDRATLERLQAVKSRVDPTGVFTCGHPVTSPAAPAA